MRFADAYKFLKLAVLRKRTVEDYFLFQRFQASQISEDLERYNISSAKRFLDIGSGIGGYIYEFADRYPNILFVSLDLNPLPFAQEKYKNKNIFTIRGDASKPPLKDKSFNFIFASSVIEHIDNQDDFLKSISNMTLSIAYISFPPFYSLVGGHSISPLHYLPGELPFKIYSKFYRQKYSSFKNYGLVKTTLKSMENLARPHFQILEIKPRFFNTLKPLIKIPLLREYVCPHIEFFLKVN